MIIGAGTLALIQLMIASGATRSELLRAVELIVTGGLVTLVIISRTVFAPALQEVERVMDQVRGAQAALEWHRDQINAQTASLENDNAELIAKRDELVRMNEALERDNAERRYLEGEYRESQARYRSLIDAMAEGVLLRDVNGTIVAWNVSAATTLGIGAEQVDGGQALDPRAAAIKEDGTPLPIDEHPESISLRTGVAVDRFILGVRRPDGALRWLSVNSRALRDPGEARPRGVVSTFEDVTESRITQQKLALLTAVIEATPDFVGVSRTDGYGVYVNSAARRMTGVSPDADITKMHFKVAHPAWVTERLQKEAWPALKRHGIWRGTTALLDLNGREVPTSQVLVAHHGPDGRIEYVSTILRDVSELKAIAEVATRGREEAEAANRAKSDFLARMNHELRTPLTAIIGFTQVVMRNKSGTLAASEIALLDRVQVNGKHLLELINSILDLSKIESGLMSTVIEPVDLVALARDAIITVEAHAEAKGLDLRIEPPQLLVPTAVDRMKMKQVLINLLSNAVKFTEKGSVTVRITADIRGNARTIEVEDTGIGIPKDRQALVFEPFEQCEATTSRRFGGTGLGLPISKSFCEMMGARLTMLSDEGSGSIFRVELAPPAIRIVA
jgi:PAS domain S-box-containing protein